MPIEVSLASPSEKFHDAFGRPTHPGWMQTFTGRRFFLMNPDDSNIVIEDIAHHLSLLCRFTGAIRQFYSVAQHSVYVSQLVPAEHRLWALLHDASEAYLGDMGRPLKILPEMLPFRLAEKNMQRAICHAFGLEETEPPCVKEADNMMLAAEAYQLLPGGPRAEWTIWPIDKVADITVEPIPPHEAKSWFLAKFAEYSRAR